MRPLSIDFDAVQAACDEIRLEFEKGITQTGLDELLLRFKDAHGVVKSDIRMRAHHAGLVMPPREPQPPRVVHRWDPVTKTIVIEVM